VADAGGEVSIVRLLAVQLDLQAQVVERVGVAQGVLVVDLTGLVKVEKRLVEGLHAKLARALHDVLDLVHLSLEDQVRNQR